MTIDINLDEASDTIHLLVDRHLILTAEKYSPGHISFKNFDAIVDDAAYQALKTVATTLLNLTSS